MTIPTPSAEPEDDVIEVAMAKAICSAFGITYDDKFGSMSLETLDAHRAARAALSASGLLERERVLREALEPFAKIDPSSFYPNDGSEAEHYTVVLWDGTRHECRDFTGADLARARTALSNPLKTEAKA